MNNRDWRLIANVLRAAHERGDQVGRTIEFFAIALRQENPRFKPEGFFKACGYRQEDQPQ
jgi:hypothetical protein